MAITPIKVAFSKNSIRDVQDVADEICRELFSSELFQSVENFNFIVGFESRRIYGSCYSEMGWKSDTITFAVQPVVVLKDGVTVENCGTGEKLGKEGHPWILSLK